MAKKKEKESISWHPDAKPRAMQAELQAWMEKHDLTHDTKWWTTEEFYDGKHLEFSELPHLVLKFEGDLYNVFSGPPDLPGIEEFRKCREEFDAIVERRGYWYDFVDHITICFMPESSEA